LVIGNCHDQFYDVIAAYLEGRRKIMETSRLRIESGDSQMRCRNGNQSTVKLSLQVVGGGGNQTKTNQTISFFVFGAEIRKMKFTQVGKSYQI
jgi:hypothetical protein